MRTVLDEGHTRYQITEMSHLLGGKRSHMVSVAPPLAPTATARERRSFAGGHGREVFSAAATRLRRHVSYETAVWHGTDPFTLMPTSPTLIENVPPGHCVRYWDHEFQVEDVMLFRDLARARVPVATLHATTDDNPGRSTRFREFLAPLGYGDQLRAVFRLGARTWGHLDLLRDEGRPAFSPRDVAAVSAMCTHLAGELASLARRERPEVRADAAEGPGTAVFDGAGTLSTLDDRADHWFAALAGADWQVEEALLGPMSALVARARAVAEGRDRGPADARVQTRDGRWLVLHASALRGPTAGTVVVVQPARLAEIAPILAEAYALTQREREIACALGRGASNAEIAGELYLSQHTVRDHLKTIFGKVGVTSRGELAARLFADEQRPSMRALGVA
jgi:DNA-binding NarL/FixJ family response regulator